MATRVVKSLQVPRAPSRTEDPTSFFRALRDILLVWTGNAGNLDSVATKRDLQTSINAALASISSTTSTTSDSSSSSTLALSSTVIQAIREALYSPFPIPQSGAGTITITERDRYANYTATGVNALAISNGLYDGQPFTIRMVGGENEAYYGILSGANCAFTSVTLGHTGDAVSLSWDDTSSAWFYEGGGAQYTP